jgi:flagellar hook-length control protein FliK
LKIEYGKEVHGMMINAGIMSNAGCYSDAQPYLADSGNAYGQTEAGFTEYIKQAMAQCEPEKAETHAGYDAKSKTQGVPHKQNPVFLGKNQTETDEEQAVLHTAGTKTANLFWLTDEEADEETEFKFPEMPEMAVLLSPQTVHESYIKILTEWQSEETEIPLTADEPPKTSEIPETPTFTKPETPETSEKPVTPSLTNAEIPETMQTPEIQTDTQNLQITDRQLTIDSALREDNLTIEAPQTVQTTATAEIPQTVVTQTPQVTATAETRQTAVTQTTEQPQTLQAAEKPETSAVRNTPDAPKTPQNGEDVQKAVKDMFGKVKVTVDRQEITAEREETFRSDELFPKARVEIKHKPEEMNQLLERFKAANPEKPVNPESADKTETPKSAKNPESLFKTETQETTETHAGREAPVTAQSDTKPVFVSIEKATLPQGETDRISSQILTKMSEAKGTTTFEMSLNPENLGKITVKLVMSGAGITAEIVAEKAETALLLQNSADRITAALERNDARLETFNVAVEQRQDYSEQRENQDQNRQSYEPETEEAGEEEIEISFAELIQSM